MCNPKAAKILLSGFYGVMGQNVFQVACAPGMRNFLLLKGGLENPEHPRLGDFQMPWGEGGKVLCLDADGHIPKDLLPADVLIDFSKPAAASVANMEAAARVGLPMIVCSTGHDHIQKDLIRDLAQRFPACSRQIWRRAQTCSSGRSNTRPARCHPENSTLRSLKPITG